jgi:glycosyltransferase involved in cell wall biosynthesis
LAARLAGVSRWYCSGHNDDSFRKLLPVRLFQGVLWRQVTAGIAISEALRRFMIDIEFAPPHKIHTVPYGFDPAEMPSADTRKEVLRRALDLPQDSFIFGSVCRLVPQKGLIHALHALAGLNADLTLRPAHYVIAGDGPLRDSLSQAAATLGVTERVHFLGWRGDARQLYAAFDAFLMPSLWEGFGLVALEAMAAGLPILASQVSALPEIILEGETGYLTPPAEAAPLAARMRDLVRDPARAAQMGQAGRRRLETVFSVQRMVEGTLRVYRDYSTIS